MTNFDIVRKKRKASYPFPYSLLTRPSTTLNPLGNTAAAHLSFTPSMAAAAQHSSSPVLPAILRPNLNLPKSLLSLPDSCGSKRGICLACASSGGSASTWRSAANYARVRDWTVGGKGFSGCGRSVSQRPFQRRAGFVRCATIDEIEAEKSLIEKDVKQRMEKTIENVRANFNSIRTGRSHPAMLDKVQVEYYGSPLSLKNIAQISTPDSSSLLVQPYDKSSLKVIEKAIVSSNLGLTPNNDGEVIRLSLPQLTNERRKELSKAVAKLTEEGKVALRNIRRDVLKAYEKLEKDKKLSEDNVKDLSSDLQKLTDEYMKKIDSIYKQKEKELLTV